MFRCHLQHLYFSLASKLSAAHSKYFPLCSCVSTSGSFRMNGYQFFLPVSHPRSTIAPSMCILLLCLVKYHIICYALIYSKHRNTHSSHRVFVSRFLESNCSNFKCNEFSEIICIWQLNGKASYWNVCVHVEKRESARARRTQHYCGFIKLYKVGNVENVRWWRNTNIVLSLIFVESVDVLFCIFWHWWWRLGHRTGQQMSQTTIAPAIISSLGI